MNSTFVLLIVGFRFSISFAFLGSLLSLKHQKLKRRATMCHCSTMHPQKSYHGYSILLSDNLHSRATPFYPMLILPEAILAQPPNDIGAPLLDHFEQQH